MGKYFEKLKFAGKKVMLAIKTNIKFEKIKHEVKLSEFFRNSPLVGIELSRDRGESRNDKAVE